MEADFTQVSNTKSGSLQARQGQGGRELVYFECLLGMNVWMCGGGGV